MADFNIVWLMSIPSFDQIATATIPTVKTNNKYIYWFSWNGNCRNISKRVFEKQLIFFIEYMVSYNPTLPTPYGNMEDKWCHIYDKISSSHWSACLRNRPSDARKWAKSAFQAT